MALGRMEVAMVNRVGVLLWLISCSYGDDREGCGKGRLRVGVSLVT